MNEKQVKKWLVLLIVFLFMFMIIPVTWSVLGNVTDWGVITVRNRVQYTIIECLMWSFVILMIYSKEVLIWMDKTRIGHWILAPVSSYKK